ncbi:NACHT domain-containing protein [Vibrio anguillarum]|nr:NACHT domain-containing protein [Vibrio anguillarum]MBF4335029.1 NACHT domain-containing protein [Vibrio anguillarum]
MYLDEDMYSRIQAFETTYNDFIWKNCIGDDFKVSEEIPKVNYYTDQEMKCGEEIYSSSVDKLADILSSNSDYISSLLVGDGGCGKSSLCVSLYSKLAQNNNCVPFFISSEAIRNYVEETNYIPDFIGGLYDLYEIQAKCNQQRVILDRKKFDISLCAGNIVIIIDGLDEFPSIFGDKFDTSVLLTSISESHSQLGKSRILITSRDTKFVDSEQFSQLDIKKYELLGFKESDCKRYIRKRFRGKADNIDNIASMIVSILQENTFEMDERVIPFILVQICNIYESSDSIEDFTNFFGKTNLPFKCLNTFTDHIVYGIFKREKNRHKFPISAYEMLNLFTEFSARHGSQWPLDKIMEEVGLLYDDKSEAIIRCIKINSLIKFNEDCLIIKNDFTLSYLKSIYYINTLASDHLYNESVEAFSKLRYESKEFNDLKKFLVKDKINIIQTIAPAIDFMKSELRKEISRVYKLQLICSIENLFYLAMLASKDSTKDNATKLLKEFFSTGVHNTIENCYIKGDLPPLDFSYLTVTKSKFSYYPKFLSSKFEQSNFMYTEFSNCHNPAINTKNILDAKFDKNTCILGDLEYSLNSISENMEKEIDFVEGECKRFFSSFRKGIYFKDNNKQHIKFSTSVNGLTRKGFDSLIKEKYIEISQKKEVDVFYKIASNFEDSVKEFMSNAITDDLMAKFIHHISK